MNKKVLKIAIDLSWIILVACSIIKILGGDWFRLMSDVGVGHVLDTDFVASTVVCSITSYCMFNFYYLAICEKRNFRPWVHFILLPYFVGMSVLKMFIDPRFYILLDLVSNFIVPLLLVCRSNKKYFRIVIAYVLNCGFQAISVYIRNIGITQVMQGSLFVELLLSIDVTIMLVLYYLYSLYGILKKEVE